MSTCKCGQPRWNCCCVFTLMPAGTNTAVVDEKPLTIESIEAAMDDIKKIIRKSEYQGKLPDRIDVGGIIFIVSEYMPEGTAMISIKAARMLLAGLEENENINQET